MSVSAPTLRRIILLVLVLLAVPAATALPMTADLAYDGWFSVSGAATWRADDGGVEMRTGPSVPSYSFTASATRADVTIYSWERQYAVLPPLYEHDAKRDPATRTETLHDLALEVTSLRPGAFLVLGVQEGGLQAAFEQARIANAWGVWFAPGSDIGRQAPDRFVPDYAWHQRDQVVLEPDRLDLEADGTLRLSFFEADIGIDSADGRTTYTTGERQEAAHHTAVGETAHTSVFRIVTMVLHDATVTARWGGTSHIAATQPRIDVDGAIDIPDARGDLVYDRLGLFPHEEPVNANGTFHLEPLVDPVAEMRDAAAHDAIGYYESGDLALTGDASEVALSSTAIRTPWSKETSAVAVVASGAGLLAIAFAAWRWGPLAFAVLYSRLEQGALLDNPMRAQIYQIVCTNPGISARQVHHLSDASWGTVVHHLAKLKDAGYVAARSQGRAKCYYENHGKWDGHQSQLALLSHKKTRSLAVAIAQDPGRDQAALVGCTGLPQSTVSYHLLKLEKEGLISKERSGPALCYHPTVTLGSVLARLQEGDPGSLRGPSRTGGAV